MIDAASHVRAGSLTQVSTPRRARPSQRLSLLPKDLLFSPYAEKDAQAAARLQSPLKPVARYQPSALTAAPSALSASFVAAREDSEEASEEDEAMDLEEQQINDVRQAELDQEASEEEKEDQADDLSSEEDEEDEEEDEEKENTPIAGTPKATVSASVCLPPVDLIVSRSDPCRVFCSAPSLGVS